MTFLLSILVFTLAVVLLSLGVILGGRKIKGSCGGLNTLPGIESDCGGACHPDPDKAESECPRHKKSCANHGRQACEKHASDSPEESSWQNPRP